MYAWGMQIYAQTLNRSQQQHVTRQGGVFESQLSTPCVYNTCFAIPYMLSPSRPDLQEHAINNLAAWDNSPEYAPVGWAKGEDTTQQQQHMLSKNLYQTNNKQFRDFLLSNTIYLCPSPIIHEQTSVEGDSPSDEGRGKYYYQ